MPVPPRLRGYAVERLLGAGATSTVWQARVAATGEPVALKYIRIEDEHHRERARAEAALLAGLEHPSLVRVHSMLTQDDGVVLVLDLAGGGSLARLLAARGRLTPGEVITAIAPIAAALEYVHGTGVIHGDVSAANILFTAAGDALLADVGVARLTGDRTEVESSTAYIDPLVAAGAVPGTPSDVFMLAAVALHALTGEALWPDADPDAALARAATGQLTGVAQRLEQAGVGAEMSAVLVRALDADPQRRGTAADLALDLAHSARPVAVELAAGAPAGTPSAPPTRIVGVRPRPAIPRPTRSTRSTKPTRRPARPLAATLIAGLVSAGVVAAAVGWALPGDPSGRRSGGAASGPVGNPSSAPVSGAAGGPVGTARGASGADAPRTPPDSANAWGEQLRSLDALRAQAFADRDASLLREVYLPGELLSADAAALARLVRPGCGLFGAQTTYRQIRVLHSGRRVVLTTRATLAPARLLCRGALRARSPGSEPASLRIVLRKTPHGVRIAAQRKL